MLVRWQRILGNKCGSKILRHMKTDNILYWNKVIFVVVKTHRLIMNSSMIIFIVIKFKSLNAGKILKIFQNHRLSLKEYVIIQQILLEPESNHHYNNKQYHCLIDAIVYYYNVIDQVNLESSSCKHFNIASKTRGSSL